MKILKEFLKKILGNVDTNEGINEENDRVINTLKKEINNLNEKLNENKEALINLNKENVALKIVNSKLENQMKKEEKPTRKYKKITEEDMKLWDKLNKEGMTYTQIAAKYERVDSTVRKAVARYRNKEK